MNANGTYSILANISNLARGILPNLSSSSLNGSMEPQGSQIDPPSHLLQDYIELGCFLSIFMIGTPLNGYIFIHQVQEYRALARVKKLDTNIAFLLYKIHLNLANLMILLFHCTAQGGWLITYKWMAGNLACKCVQFINMVSFIISSNMVAVIAADRLRNVVNLEKLTKGYCSSSTMSLMSGRDVLKPVKVMLWIAWTTTILFSLPQWWVFGTVTIMHNWHQCSSLWDRWRFKTSDPNVANMIFISEKAYLIFHLITIFWLPFLIICLCYILIAGKLFKFSCQTLQPQANQLQDHDGKKSPVAKSTRAQFPSPTPFHSRVQTASSSHSCSSIPEWRNTMRSKMFRTTAVIVLAYMLCWTPYNALSLVVFFDVELAAKVSDHANWCKQLILLNVVLNPFLYGFGSTYHTVTERIWSWACGLFKRRDAGPEPIFV